MIYRLCPACRSRNSALERRLFLYGQPQIPPQAEFLRGSHDSVFFPRPLDLPLVSRCEATWESAGSCRQRQAVRAEAFRGFAEKRLEEVTAAKPAGAAKPRSGGVGSGSASFEMIWREIDGRWFEIYSGHLFFFEGHGRPDLDPRKYLQELWQGGFVKMVIISFGGCQRLRFALNAPKKATRDASTNHVHQKVLDPKFTPTWFLKMVSSRF